MPPNILAVATPVTYDIQKYSSIAVLGFGVELGILVASHSSL